MNYDEIENLSQSQVMDLYNEIVEGENNFFSAVYAKWYVVCDNGKTGTTGNLWEVDNYWDTSTSVGAHCADNRYHYRIGGGATADI